MSDNGRTVTLTINGRQCSVPDDLTVLQAAEQHDAYIPTLCNHEGLSPFGGCRMCVVEIEGMRGLPTACTTKVADDMVVQTETETVQAIRQEVLKLILSEHPVTAIVEADRVDVRIMLAGEQDNYTLTLEDSRPDQVSVRAARTLDGRSETFQVP